MKRCIISLILLCSFSAAGAADAPLAANAPDRYIVVPGDTLWSIAGRFLKDPWRWPELMRMNADQIRNPNRIYPGDVLVLDRSGDNATLRLQQERTVRLSPQARSVPLETAAIPSIPPAAIEPFLTKPLVIETAALDAAPKIVATQENRVVIGAGSVAYAKGLTPEGGEFWQVFRPGNPLIDPDTNQPLGYEAIYLGEARVIHPGDVSTIELLKSTQEVYVGDRMFAAQKSQFPSYVPHAPDKNIQGRIISAYGNMFETGPTGIVTVNRGAQDGLEAGHVLAIYRSVRAIREISRNDPLYGRTGLFQIQRPDATNLEPLSGIRNTPVYGRQGPTGTDNSIKGAEPPPDLPNERYGLLYVFRTFDHVSYALVMEATRPVQLYDVVQNP